MDPLGSHPILTMGCKRERYEHVYRQAGDIGRCAARTFCIRLRISGGYRATQRPVPRCHAPARHSIPRTSRRNRASCPQLCRRFDHRRQKAEAAGQLWAGARHSAERSGDRSQAPSVRGDRSPRRPRSGDRRLQGGQRDRRGDEGRPPLLLHRLPARTDARPDHRGHRESRGGLHRKSHRPASGRRRQAMRDRQLPGRLGAS